MGWHVEISMAARLLLIITIVLMLENIAEGGRNNATTLTRALKRYIKTHKQAASFEAGKRDLEKEFRKSFRKREVGHLNYWETKEWLEEDCCGSGEEECNQEEREEYRVESESRSYVNRALCELSINEGKGCKCTGGNYNIGTVCGKAYKCSQGKLSCNHIDATAYCQAQYDQKMCYNQNQKCDSNNDCNDWQDEGSDCKFPKGSTITIVGQDLECCTEPSCRSYRGKIATTINGKTCQAWNKQTPHKHTRTPQNYPSSGLVNNYCRNPDGEPWAWCYTMETRRYERCNTPRCEAGPELYYGNVMIGGRPICDIGWDDVDAKIVCKELKFGGKKFGANTKGIATKNGKFGSSPTNFIISEVECNENNKNFRDCPHKTRNVCQGGGLAGVVCVDPEELTLVKQKQGKNEGNIMLHGKYPVCGINWNRKGAQVVCNSLYKNKFSDRPKKQVPVFKHTINSAFGPVPTEKFIMYNVQCTGEERWLTDCAATYYPLATNEKCTVDQAAGVQCAKCTITDLKEIIDKVKRNTDFSDTKKNVRDAFTKLKTDCHPWDCSPGIAQVYPEYCIAYEFLHTFDQMVNDIKRKKTSVQEQKLRTISLKFDMVEQIRYIKDDENAKLIQSSIGDVQVQTGDFQTKLGMYFIKMASYDEKKAVADFLGAKQVWTVEKQQIAAVSEKLQPNLAKLFKVAFSIGGLNVADKTLELSLAIASLAQPANAALNPGEIAGVAKDINTAAGLLMDATANLVELGYTFRNSLPKFIKLSAEIQSNYVKNEKQSNEMGRILRINDLIKFTEKDANSFLDLYGDFDSAITTEQLSWFTSLLTEIVDDTCEVVTAEGSGAIAAAVRMAFVGLCPEIKKDRDTLIDLVTAAKDSEEVPINMYAQVARSKLAINEAQSFKIVTGKTSINTIAMAVAGKKAYVLYQLQKVMVIRGACDLVKYRNYGVDEPYCTTLLANPNGDLSMLLAGLRGSNADMCKQPLEITVNIPADIRRSNNKSPQGTLDLSVLLNPKVEYPSTDFQIPDKKWLVANKWLTRSEAKRGPIYLKKFELFLPHWYGKDEKKIHTQFTLLKNTLEPNGDLYNFDEEVSYIFRYTDFKENCNSKKIVKNPYNTPGCLDNQLPKPCIETEGVNKGQKIYPSLMSLWKVQLDLADYFNSPGLLPFSPSGKVNLKANVALCFQRSISDLKKRKVEEIEKRYKYDCCAEKSPPQVAVGFSCQRCSGLSVPRLNGYYCESCPAGYEPRDKGPYEQANWVFGCQPCKAKFFKASEGDVKCQPCATADEVGAVRCS